VVAAVNAPAQLADLLDLQQEDLAIDRLLHRRQTLPELAQLATASDQKARLDAELARLSDELRGLERDADKAEGELELVELKLRESETRLYAGGMSARETEQKRMEVLALRGQQGALEERVLGVLDLLDPVRVEAARLQAEQATVTAEIDRLQALVAAAWKEIDAEIARHERRKAEIAAPIATDLLDVYEHLRETKEGVAVGRLEAGICGGCHLALSRPEQAEAATWQPPRCIHCMRILVI
jgi:predicted  nucleic acid-binding Zn-ribbon protein